MKAVTKCGKIVRYRKSVLGIFLYSLDEDKLIGISRNTNMADIFRLWRVK